MRLEDFIVVRAVDEGANLEFRNDIRPGDLVRRRDRVASGGWRTVISEQQMVDFYRALGIELWGDWRWVG